MPPERLSVEDIKTIGLRSIYAQLQPKQTQQRLCDIELPTEVVELIHNPVYNNRYKWLQREYGEEFLLKVAKMAKAIGKDPKRLFASSCSKANIDRTIKIVKEYYAKAEMIAKVIIERPTVYVGYIYKNMRRLSSEALRIALARSSDHINQGAGFVLVTRL